MHKGYIAILAKSSITLKKCKIDIKIAETIVSILNFVFDSVKRQIATIPVQVYRVVPIIILNRLISIVRIPVLSITEPTQ